MDAPELARRLGVGPKALRSWLRQTYGHRHELHSRWVLDDEQVRAAECRFGGRLVQTAPGSAASAPPSAPPGDGQRGGTAVDVLPDYLAPGLRVVFCGTAVGLTSAVRGHYYAHSGNEFWSLLYQSGLTPIRLRPEDDGRVLKFGIGLTDLAKRVAAASDENLGWSYDVGSLERKIEASHPAWVAFHGKEAAKAVQASRQRGRRVRLGVQERHFGGSRVFVVPSASGSNRDRSRLEGRHTRLAWFEELAGLIAHTGVVPRQRHEETAEATEPS
jgi:TDG/mug DNA glycosylase family protein